MSHWKKYLEFQFTWRKMICALPKHLHHTNESRWCLQKWKYHNVLNYTHQLINSGPLCTFPYIDNHVCCVISIRIATIVKRSWLRWKQFTTAEHVAMASVMTAHPNDAQSQREAGEQSQSGCVTAVSPTGDLQVSEPKCYVLIRPITEYKSCRKSIDQLNPFVCFSKLYWANLSG